MSRGFAVFIFWLIGFGVGFAGYLSLPGIADWFTTSMPKFIDQAVIGALIAGMIGSAVSTFTVVTWANRAN
ncbi:MAG: hypothetical protein ACM3ZS_01230 [Nitrososphaerota archaeon]|nr:hypothetical protein [Nitrososphaeraceae archaeon]HEU4468515.1 hypothetical protein [Nitrososphaeraceae archaeon]HVE37009.1 hypothetical protein [Nitrososphaeraceae archaeon]